jgi:hypothetical protein
VNPILIAEVLSKSTEAIDRGVRFREYRKIDSLREYVLVSQTAPLIEVFVRGAEGDWRLLEFAGLDAVCHLSSIDCNLEHFHKYCGAGWYPAADWQSAWPAERNRPGRLPIDRRLTNLPHSNCENALAVADVYRNIPLETGS